MRSSDRLLQVPAEYERVAVITHDTPDPDAIAAGWAVYVLVRERLKKAVRLIGGGAKLRAQVAKVSLPPRRQHPKAAVRESGRSLFR